MAEGGAAKSDRAAWRALVAWTLVLMAATFVLWRFRESLGEAHKTLVLLLLVLVASARHGRAVGFALAALSFAAFNFFLLPPYYTLRLEDPLDWSVLFGFLVTGGVAAQLFHLAQEARVTNAELSLERTRLAAEADRVAALRDADRLKDAFIASVSHDLRTPLTTIRALASEMRDAHDERAVIIEEEAERLNRMVTDLLDLSRLRAGALVPDLQVIAAEDLIGATLQRLAGVPGRERIVVRLPSDGTLPTGRMDFVQSLRVLGNLLENALRHSPGDRAVELEVDVEGRNLVFRVLDRGLGIRDADRDRIFEAFQRGTSAAPEKGAGAGLGLAIARSLAEAQGGALEYSARPGGGSAFVFSLPAESVVGLP